LLPSTVEFVVMLTSHQTVESSLPAYPPISMNVYV